MSKMVNELIQWIWAEGKWNIRKFRKDKCEVLHLRRNPWQHNKLGSSSAEKDLLPGDSRLSMRQQPALAAEMVSGILSCI